MKVQERFRKEALLIGKSWSLWTNAKCQVFSSFGRRDHTLLFKRVDDENVGGGGRGRNDSDVRFADKVYRCVISQMASHLSAQRFGPCRRVTSRMASTMLFTSRAFPPLFFFSLPRRHSARVSPLTHAFPDCAELNAAILCGESRPRNAPYNVGKFMLIFRIVGCRVYTRYPLIFHETKVEKKKTLPVATYRGDDESAMKFHYRGMFTKRSNILISRSLEIMFPVP